MLTRKRRCPECEYEWSPYLRFPTCPRCGSDIVNAELGLERTRTKRVVIVSIIIGTIVSILANLILLLFD